MVDAIAEILVKQINRQCGCRANLSAGPADKIQCQLDYYLARIDWIMKLPEPLKQHSIVYTLWFYEEHVVLDTPFNCPQFEYCDPQFPDNLLAMLPNKLNFRPKT